MQQQAYLRNFWYAAALSSSVTDDAPHGVDLLGGRVVLFRDAETGEVRRQQPRFFWGGGGGSVQRWAAARGSGSRESGRGKERREVQRSVCSAQ